MNGHRMFTVNRCCIVLVVLGICGADNHHRGKADSAIAIKRRAAILGALISDAMCLGSNHEYNSTLLKSIHSNHAGDEFLKPEIQLDLKKLPGDNTNHGDANYLFLEWLVQTHGSQRDLESYLHLHLKTRFTHFPQESSDVHAKAVVDKLQSGIALHNAAADDDEMMFRCVGALAVYEDLEELKAVCRDTTAFTHQHQNSINVASFWAEVVWRVIHEAEEPEMAMLLASQASEDQFIQMAVTKAYAKAKQFIERDPEDPLFLNDVDNLEEMAVMTFGLDGSAQLLYPSVDNKGNHTAGALSATVFLILRHHGNYKAAVKANIIIGGDSAARAIPIGMVLGAWLEFQGHKSDLDHKSDLYKGIPRKMVKRLTRGSQIVKMLNVLPLTSIKHMTREQALHGHEL